MTNAIMTNRAGMPRGVRRAMALAALVGLAFAAAPANAGGFDYPHFRDGTQAYNSRAIAGAGPNWYATFIRGVRCQYEYRVVRGPNGPQRIRVEVCN